MTPAAAQQAAVGHTACVPLAAKSPGEQTECKPHAAQAASCRTQTSGYSHNRVSQAAAPSSMLMSACAATSWALAAHTRALASVSASARTLVVVVPPPLTGAGVPDVLAGLWCCCNNNCWWWWWWLLWSSGVMGRSALPSRYKGLGVSCQTPWAGAVGWSSGLLLPSCGGSQPGCRATGEGRCPRGLQDLDSGWGRVGTLIELNCGGQHERAVLWWVCGTGGACADPVRRGGWRKSTAPHCLLSSLAAVTTSCVGHRCQGTRCGSWVHVVRMACGKVASGCMMFRSECVGSNTGCV